jgi:hypothetical protein
MELRRRIRDSQTAQKPIDAPSADGNAGRTRADSAEKSKTSPSTESSKKAAPATAPVPTGTSGDLSTVNSEMGPPSPKPQNVSDFDPMKPTSSVPSQISSEVVAVISIANHVSLEAVQINSTSPLFQSLLHLCSKVQMSQRIRPIAHRALLHSTKGHS